jgi:serine/threonine protein kinase
MTKKVGPYQILGTLRAGARPLYKAQAADGRTVALKTAPASGLTPEERERFLREAQISECLDHPNLLKVHDSGEAEGILYQAMDLLEGSDLAKVFDESRTFSWEEKLSIMEQVCAGLEYAHKQNLVHRDIKPANIFLENSGHIRILDFGMVKTSSSNLTQVGSALGTVNYMAPEQIRCEACTAASDVFSCGIVFYRLSSGQHPFSKPGMGLAQIVSAIVFETPAPLGQVAAGAPEGLEFVVKKCLEKDPAKRWTDGGDLNHALTLCRLTLKMQPAVAAAAGTSSAAVEESPDLDKTIVIRIDRIRTPLPRAPESPPPAQAVPQPAPPEPIALRKPSGRVYCAACTTANLPGALTCSGCGAPLGNIGPQPSPPIGTPWRTIAVLAAVLVSFLIIVVVLLLRR